MVLIEFLLKFLFKYLCLCVQFSNAVWQEYNSHILHIFHGIELLYTRAWWARYTTVMFRFTFSIGQRKFREVCQWTSSTWPTQKSLISLSYTRDLTLKQLLYCSFCIWFKDKDPSESSKKFNMKNVVFDYLQECYI